MVNLYKRTATAAAVNFLTRCILESALHHKSFSCLPCAKGGGVFARKRRRDCDENAEKQPFSFACAKQLPLHRGAFVTIPLRLYVVSMTATVAAVFLL